MTWRPLRRTATRARTAALGYTSVAGDEASAATDAEAQRRAIREASERLGLELLDVLDDRAPEAGEPRPGLTDALGRIEAGDASCLVVPGLERMSSDVAELAALIDRLERRGVRLIALDVGLDTATPTGRLAVERRPSRELPWMPAEAPDEGAVPDAPPEAAAEPVPDVAPDVAAPAPEIAPVPAPEVAPEPEPEVAEPEPEVATEPEPEVATEPEPEVAPEPAPQAIVTPVPQETVRAVGYTSVAAAAEAGGQELEDQRRAIERSCEGPAFELIEIVADREPKDGKALDRPGLSHVINRIAAGDASCLVVSGLERLSRSVAELGTLMRWLERNDVRLIAVELGLDTSTSGGRVTARALASVGEWERDRLAERTRTGLAAARAKRHVASGWSEADWTALRKRIAAMRADGMTLQAIADTLNEEGVPTQRGGVKWRPSGVQTAAGYKRRSHSKSLGDLPPVKPPGKKGDQA